MEQKIKSRNEIQSEYKWNLSHIFKDDSKWIEEYESIKEYPEKIVLFCGKLGESANTLLDFLRLNDEISVRLGKLYGYASCKNDEDTSNSFYQDMKGKATNIYIEILGALSFANPEITDIEDKKLDEFYSECPLLKEYERSIYSVRRKKAHILSQNEEKLLAAAGEISDFPDNISGIFHNADLKFPDVEDKNGKVHALTNGSFVPLLESDDRDLRKKVYETYYKTLGGFKNTVAATLDAQFKQLKFFSNARKYENTLCASLDSTEVPNEVYHNLIKTVRDNMDKMYRYVSLRKKMLGYSELNMWDVYTPIVSNASETFTFEDSKKIVLEALSVLGTDYTDILKEGFENGWIDVYENTGKRSGAYSSGSSRPHPYVLLNHKDNLDSLFTLAHEMGHAVHSYLSCKNQPVSNSDYVIFVAEVASTCNEVLLMKYLLNKTTDKKKRAYLINHFLDQFKGTLYRQTMFAEFELMMGEMCESSQTLTADLLCEKYLELNKLYFGNEMNSDELISLEWARIPHFFYNYYVFQYATGFSAAVAIASKILNEGESAAESYKKFLSSGSSTDPISLLKIAGVDMSSPKPINEALKLFDELLDEMESII